MTTEKSSIYTRKGDDGTTSLFNFKRCSKTEIYFEALGDIDEVNALIGTYKNVEISNGRLKTEDICWI